MRGDLDQLAQVGLNVIVNGIRAIGDQGGTIRIAIGVEPKELREMAFFKIENDGPPIDVEEREHLFDPFHSKSDGTGLGLSISARIVGQHDGLFEVSEGVLGVAFTVYLPHAPEERP